MKNNCFVFDTNTIISAFLFRNSVPTLAYEKARRMGKLVASADTYNELTTVFLRSKFEKYASLADRLAFTTRLKDFLVFHEISEAITACRDAKDNKFLELAVAASAACIITGDADLLALHPFRTIPIFSASDFIQQF